MNVVVFNCFDWKEYHFVEKFINEGIEVIGVGEITDPQQEFLYSLIGRNARFTWKNNPREFTVGDSRTVVISFQKSPSEMNEIVNSCLPKGEYYILMEEKNRKKVEDPAHNEVVILIPPTVGPWMSEEEFKKVSKNDTVLFVDDLVQSVYDLTQEKNKENLLHFTYQEDTDGFCLGKRKVSTFSSDQAVQKVLNHIEQWKDIYYRLK
ncbi:hypothetical protein GWK91_01310 [Virgibacillus sp. MSP4-1]|uniref:hypothetical protein n=1 Tax=Virgibacillus sp. MSP4-1 TaxID=2700081 RepID=UPI0003A982DB|nr:hypothetical protein [Virgibacillus sp. MSP4-1]QHS21672.1 hypothetical protein GWK91_01310 [Virgibacillus sp. MSP4-1]